MRRLMLLLLVLMLPAVAFALPGTPYDPATMMYYPQLTPDQQAIFDACYDAALNGREDVTLPDGTAYDDAVAAVKALLMDCPELCALSGSYSVRYYRDEPQVARGLLLEYDMPVERQVTLVRTAGALAARAQGDDFAREVFLHDRLLETAAYTAGAPHSHSAYGALVEGQAVCDGYANAMTLLMRMAGLRCGTVSGRATADPGVLHAWNVVRVDGVWTLLDATNNDQSAGGTYFFFNVTDEWMRRDYVPDAALPLPRCTDASANWHVRQGLMIPQEADQERAILTMLRRMAQTGGAISLRFEDESAYRALLNDPAGWIMRYNDVAAPGEELPTGTIRTWFRDEQRSVILAIE